MRIALLSTGYPPANREGIARQRQILAQACTRMGHTVHVFTLDLESGDTCEAGVHVHRIHLEDRHFHAPGINRHRLVSTGLFSAVRAVHATTPFDVLDAPIWSATGWAAVERNLIPVVINLQTTTAQIAAINHVESTDIDDLISLEKRCVHKAAGILADSIGALETTRNDYGLPASTPTVCVYHGIPDIPPTPSRSARKGDRVEALVTGRLEKRKGIPVLFQILPHILQTLPSLTVRFVGPDNSLADGWYEEHRCSYREYWLSRNPEWKERVIFEGYVSDERLAELRGQADFALLPSLYESFGFTYVEAMRSSLPVVAFSNEAAHEIFLRDETDGAILVPNGDGDALGTAMIRMTRDPNLRETMGRAGRERFLSAFQDTHMARGSIAFYEAISNQHRTTPSRPITEAQRVYQVMEALDTGDGVSQITQQLAPLLKELGQDVPVLSRWTHTEVTLPTARYHTALDDIPKALILHYWNYSRSLWLLDHVQGPQALYYHNITPPDFFPPGDPQAAVARSGYRQLRENLHRFDLLLSDSWYNLHALAKGLSDARPTLCIYPMIEREELCSAPYDDVLYSNLTQGTACNWLFVGRIARNKRQDKLMRWFDQFSRGTDPIIHLWLVGNDQQDMNYRQELERLRRTLPFGHRIHITGKVSERELISYYRAADLFLCASEHEGFCIPIAHAMAMGIPVAACATSVLPETLGESGVLIRDERPAHLFPVLHRLSFDPTLRQRIIDGQYENLHRFSREEAMIRMKAAVNFLLHRTDHPLLIRSEALAHLPSGPRS